MIICDSSSLISLSTTGLIGCLIILKKDLKKIYLTPSVVKECIETPLQVPAYSLSAVRLKRALNEKIFDIISPSEKTTYEILTYFNSILMEKKTKKPIHLIHSGEAEILAAAVENKIDYILIDERTTRAIVEDVEGLKKILLESVME
jgi:predicted nucleic acid-binding protein